VIAAWLALDRQSDIGRDMQAYLHSFSHMVFTGRVEVFRPVRIVLR
jgi:hypothetical protein